MNNTERLLIQARQRAAFAPTPAEKFRWLVIVAVLEGSKIST